MEPVDNGEFDLMIRFEGDAEDPYYYCFKDEGCHIIYHRFLQFYCKLFLTVWMSPLTVRQTLDHIPVPILFLREELVRPEES